MAGWRNFRLATGLLLAADLAGCATTPPPPAVVAYGRSDCAAQPDLSAAVSLTPEKAKPEFVVTTAIAAQTPCLAKPVGSSRPYVLYALPTDLEDKTLTVGTVLEAARAFSPEVSILDRQGQMTRTFAPADFLFRGPIYSVQFRPKPAEAYVLVTANPAQVGKSFDAVEIGIYTTTISTGYATSNWQSGVDKTVARAFSYEGKIQVTVFDGKAKAKH